MLKRLLSFTLIIAAIFSLCACDAADNTLPEGTKLAKGGEDVGYYFYIPEEWTNSGYGNIAQAFVSSVDNTQVSFVEAEKPGVTIDEYFTESLKEFTVDYTVDTENSGKECSFGNATNAVKYLYSYDYKVGQNTFTFNFMQIFAEFEDRFFIFTYCGSTELRSEDKSYYSYHLNEVQEKIINNVKFVSKTPVAPGTSQDKTNELGYKLVSDKTLCGFELYVPTDYTVEYSSAIVSIKLPDGSAISMTEATSVGVTVNEYWETRKTELATFVSDLSYEDDKVLKLKEGVGNANQAASFEYSYTYNGTRYCTYQVLAITVFRGYVFTYTATESNYQSNLAEIENIIKGIVF